MDWKTEIKYLGLHILSANKFKINIQPSKQKFFGAINGLLGKVGTKTSPHLLISLIKTFCFPILLYGLVGITLNKTVYTALNSALFVACGKIFATYNKSIILQSLFYLYTLPLDMQIDLNKLNCYAKNNNLRYLSLLTLVLKVGRIEKTKIDSKYSILSYDNKFIIRQKMFNFLSINLF